MLSIRYKINDCHWYVVKLMESLNRSTPWPGDGSCSSTPTSRWWSTPPPSGSLSPLLSGGDGGGGHFGLGGKMMKKKFKKTQARCQKTQDILQGVWDINNFFGKLTILQFEVNFIWFLACSAICWENKVLLKYIKFLYLWFFSFKTTFSTLLHPLYQLCPELQQ